MSKLAVLYEPRIARARALLTDHPAVRTLLDPALSPAQLERFLIQFSAWGVQMTEPVDRWLMRSGKRCKELGLDEIGRTLEMHAKHERGHHLMMMEDTRALVDHWNRGHSRHLDAARLLDQPATANMRNYIKLHDDIVDSDRPFGQAAIGLEIEGMSATFGPKLIAQCKAILPVDALKGLSFIEEHAMLDVGHVGLLERLCERILTDHPEHAEYLAEMGSRSLEYYLGFFQDCLDVAARELS